MGLAIAYNPEVLVYIQD